MTDELKDLPSYKNDVHQRQLKSLQMVSDLFEGTETVVAGGEKYLPREPSESEIAYKTRLGRATFYNAYGRTIAGLVGMVFRKNPVLGENVPAAIRMHAENIDMQGNHLDVFAKELFQRAVNTGHCFILVDMPPPLDKKKFSATDERKMGRRPYWQTYHKGQVLNFQTQTRGGEVRLAQVTLEEVACVPQGRFGEKKVTRYRVLMPGGWEIWQKNENDEHPVKVLDGQSSITEIPLVPIYTGKKAFFESRPPLLDLAYQNLDHYQLRSDLKRILHKASVPIFYTAGLDTEKLKKLKISPDQGIHVDVNGTVGWAEIQGTSIAAAQQEIANVEGRMAALGLSVIAEQPKSAKTATESVMEYEAESSELSSFARSLKDGLEMACDYHNQFLGAKPGSAGNVTVNKDFSQLRLSAQDISMYSQMVAAGQLSIDTLWSVLQRAEKLPDDFNADIEKQRLGDLNNAA
jgi:hypothetical protein